MSMYANQEITSKSVAEFQLTINHLLFHPIFCKQLNTSYYSVVEKNVPAMNFHIQYIENRLSSHMRKKVQAWIQLQVLNLN